MGLRIEGNEAGGRFLFAAQFGLPCKKKGGQLKPNYEFWVAFYGERLRETGRNWGAAVSLLRSSCCKRTFG